MDTNRKSDVTIMLMIAIFSSALGMFQFGFNTGVINAPQKVLEEFISTVYENRNNNNKISENFKDTIWSITVGIFAIGGMLGGYFGPKLADKLGRKGGILFNNIFALIGVTLMTFSKQFASFECIIIGRFFIGINCGAYTALVPMYLSEISTLNLRGAIGIVAQLAVTIGLLISQILGHQKVLGTEENWPYLFSFAYLPSLIQLFILPICPESPRYLLLNCNQESLTRLALRKLRNNNDLLIENEIIEMKNEARVQDEQIQLYGKVTNIFELFKHSWLREPLIIAIVMQLSQQFSGINAVFYYSTDIFLTAQISPIYAGYATMGVGIVMVLVTLISIPLIDRLGRRTLHLTGLGGMFLMSIILTLTLIYKTLFDWIKYVSVFSVLLYTLFFGIGPGPLPWMITSELFTQGSRPAAVAVATLVNWSSNFLVGLSFPLIKRIFQDYLFIPYTILLALIWIFIYYKLPETKNRTFDEISALFRRNNINNNNQRRPPSLQTEALNNKYGAIESEGKNYVITLDDNNGDDNNNNRSNTIASNNSTKFTNISSALVVDATAQTFDNNDKQSNILNTGISSKSLLYTRTEDIYQQDNETNNNSINFENQNSILDTWCYYYGHLDNACRKISKIDSDKKEIIKTWCYYYGNLDNSCNILTTKNNNYDNRIYAQDISKLSQTVLVN